jgi:hypothetical protein
MKYIPAQDSAVLVRCLLPVRSLHLLSSRSRFVIVGADLPVSEL